MFSLSVGRTIDLLFTMATMATMFRTICPGMWLYSSTSFNVYNPAGQPSTEKTSSSNPWFYTPTSPAHKLYPPELQLRAERKACETLLGRDIRSRSSPGSRGDFFPSCNYSLSIHFHLLTTSFSSPPL